jgi:hypothetical protein
MSSKKKEIPPFKMIPVYMREHLHEFTGAELKVFMCLLLHSGPDNTAYPSNELMMQETGLSPCGLASAKKGLRKKGFSVALFQRYRNDGSLSSMTEKVVLPTPRNQGEIPLKRRGMSPQDSGGGYPQNSGGHEVDTSEADTGNLDTGKPQEQLVSRSVGSVSLRSTTDSASPRVVDDEEKDKTSTGSVSKKRQDLPLGWTDDDHVSAIVFYESFARERPEEHFAAEQAVADGFGLPYIHMGPFDGEDDLKFCLGAIFMREQSSARIKDLLFFAKQHKFWKTRVLTIKNFAKHIWNQNENGLMAQYENWRDIKRQKASQA